MNQFLHLEMYGLVQNTMDVSILVLGETLIESPEATIAETEDKCEVHQSTSEKTFLVGH